MVTKATKKPRTNEFFALNSICVESHTTTKIEKMTVTVIQKSELRRATLREIDDIICYGYRFKRLATCCLSSSWLLLIGALLDACCGETLRVAA